MTLTRSRLFERRLRTRIHITINLSQVSLPFAKSSRKPASARSSGLCSASGSSTNTPAPSACRTCTSSADSARSPTTSTSALRSVCAASGWTSPSWPPPVTPRPSPHAWPGSCFTAWSEASTPSTWPWRSSPPSTPGCFTSSTTGSFLRQPHPSEPPLAYQGNGSQYYSYVKCI